MKKNLFGDKATSAGTPDSTMAEEKRKEAMAKKEEEKIKRDQKKTAKKQKTMSTKESFLLIWNVIVITVVGFWDGVKWGWTTATEYMNLSGKLGTLLVDTFGDGNSQMKDHNKKVADSALSYILMIPLYTMAGISGLFIYNITDENKKRIFDKDTSVIRKNLHKSELASWLAMALSPFQHILRLLQYTDTSNFDMKHLNVGGVITQFPYIASFFIPILLIIIMCPTLRPSLFSMILTTALIAFFVFDRIVEIWTGLSLYDMVTQSKQKLAAQNKSDDEGDSDDILSKIQVAEAMSNSTGEISEDSAGAGAGCGGISNQQMQAAGNMTVIGVAGKVAYSVVHILLGVLSIIPAAYGSAFYIWFVTLFSWIVHRISLKRILHELTLNGEAFAPKKKTPTFLEIIRRLIPGMTPMKSLITSILCILMSLSVILQIQNDPPLFIILTAIIVLCGLMFGGAMDVFLNWIEGA